jgi:hypothetical protein
LQSPGGSRSRRSSPWERSAACPRASYVFVRPDFDRDEHAESLRDRYPESKNAGFPWYAILNATGQELINSNATKPTRQSGLTNVSFPRTRREIEHFLKMLKQTASGLTEDTLSALRKAIAKE